MTRRARHLAPDRRTLPRRALIALALGAVAATTTAATTAGFTDGAATAADVRALAPECASSAVSGAADVDLGVGTFLGGWGVWAAGPWLCSPDGHWVAGFQRDGNLVAYDMGSTPGTALWNSWTFGPHVGGQATTLRLRANGDLALLDAGGNTLRSTRTAGVPTPVTVSLDDGGALTLRDANGVVRFTSAGTDRLDCKTVGAFTCDPLTNRR